MKNFRHGFTLIELLVVISIIALLMPALAKARGAAKVIKNTAQISQVMLALHSYAHDNKQYMPPSRFNQQNTLNTGNYWSHRLVWRGYISDPFVFWGPFRDITWLHTTHLNGNPSSPVLSHYMINDLSSSGSGTAYHGSGYGVNAIQFPTLWSGATTPNQSYRVGDLIPTYSGRQVSPSAVLGLTEFVSDLTPTITGRGLHSGRPLNPLFTPQGLSARAYLDGHALSQEPSDLQYTPIDEITGTWKSIYTLNNRRAAPWYGLQ